MKGFHFTRAALAILVVSTASAAIVPIEEFGGQYFEGFENLNPPGGYPAPYAICDGHATFDDTYAHVLMIATSLYSFPTNTYIYPYNGNLMGGSVTGYAAFEFATPVRQFGAFIGTADALSGGTVTFRGDEGDILATLPFFVGVGEWAWFGWESSEPIGRIEFAGSTQIGLPLVFDDVRITIPEPAALGLLAASALLLGRRR